MHDIPVNKMLFLRCCLRCRRRRRSMAFCNGSMTSWAKSEFLGGFLWKAGDFTQIWWLQQTREGWWGYDGDMMEIWWIIKFGWIMLWPHVVHWNDGECKASVRGIIPKWSPIAAIVRWVKDYNWGMIINPFTEIYDGHSSRIPMKQEKLFPWWDGWP